MADLFDIPESMQKATRDMEAVKKERVRNLIDRHKKLLTARQPWTEIWSFVSEYVTAREQEFNNETTVPGKFLAADIFNTVAQRSSQRCAASILGMLWNNGGQSFELTPNEDDMPESLWNKEDIKKYYTKLTRVVHRPFSTAKCAFSVSLSEGISEAVNYGTGGLHVKDIYDKSPDEPVKFESIDVKRSCIDEGPDGVVDTIFTQRKLTVRQAVQEFGLDKLSKKTREMYETGKELETKIKILHVIEPRIDVRAKHAYGAVDMPVASMHIEVETEHEILNSGYTTMPSFVFRFWKYVNEVYGRGPGTEVMPTILTANLLDETLLVGSEKTANPPTWSYDDGFLGGGVVNKSAGANNPMRIPQGKNGFNGQPMGPLFTVGDMTATEKQVERKSQEIREGFFEDALQELSSNGRMTLGEAQIREDLRVLSILFMFLRLLGELLEPAVDRTFNILFKHGMCGLPVSHPTIQQALAEGANPEDLFIMPDPVLKLIMEGKHVYKIRWLTTVARMMKSEQMKGIRTFVSMLAEVGKVNPDVLNVADWESIGKHIQNLGGAPEDVMKTQEALDALRKQQAQQAAEVKAAQQAQVEAKVNKDNSQAAKNQANAGSMPLSRVV